MTLFIIVLKHQWHAYSLFVSECYHIFIFIIIYLYLSLYIYIDYLLFRVWSEWLELSATYWQSSSSPQRLEIGNIIWNIGNDENYLKYRQWWELFEILEMMRIISNIGNEENYLKNWKWWELFYVWNIGNVEDYFVFSTKVFSLKLSSNSLLNVHILAHWKSFVTLLRFFSSSQMKDRQLNVGQ